MKYEVLGKNQAMRLLLSKSHIEELTETVVKPLSAQGALMTLVQVIRLHLKEITKQWL